MELEIVFKIRRAYNKNDYFGEGGGLFPPVFCAPGVFIFAIVAIIRLVRGARLVYNESNR